jgi:hypothetical protein
VRRRSLGVSIQIARSSFDIEGRSDEAGGRASEDLERGFRRRGSFIGRRRKSLRGRPTLFSGRGKLGRGSRQSGRRPRKDFPTAGEGRPRSRDAPSRFWEVRSTSGELDPRSGEAGTRPSEGRRCSDAADVGTPFPPLPRVVWPTIGPSEKNTPKTPRKSVARGRIARWSTQLPRRFPFRWWREPRLLSRRSD